MKYLVWQESLKIKLNLIVDNFIFVCHVINDNVHRWRHHGLRIKLEFDFIVIIIISYITFFTVKNSSSSNNNTVKFAPFAVSCDFNFHIFADFWTLNSEKYTKLYKYFKNVQILPLCKRLYH